MGSAMISWGSMKHKFVTLSTIEAEYIATCEECKETMWMRKLIYDLFDQVLDLTIIHYEN